MTKELTFQERIEHELDPEGLKRATEALTMEVGNVFGLDNQGVAENVVAAYLLGASEPKGEK